MYSPNPRRNQTPIRNLKGTPHQSLRRSVLASNAINQSFGGESLPSSPTAASIFGSSKHTFQTCTPSLPVRVKESISLAPDISNISVELGSNGWSWSVQDKQLFIWNHKAFPMFKNSVCKELQIPFSECYAELVCVTCSPQNQGHVSAIAVSRSTGQVCYWENIFSSSSKVLGSIELSGNQTDMCHRVLSLEEHGFIVCTSTGLIHHVKAYKSSLVCSVLKSSQGMLSGFGRRVSSLFFSPASEEASEVEVLVKREKNSFRILLLTVSSLQEWILRIDNETVNVGSVQQVELAQITKEHLSEYSWVCPLDVKLVTRKNHVLILFAVATAEEEGADVRFYVAHFQGLASIGETNMISFDYTTIYNESTLDDELTVRLLIEDPNSRIFSDIALCLQDRIIFKTILDGGKDSHEDEISFADSERVVGAGQRDGRYIFLSSVHGMIMSTTSSTSLLPPSVEESVLQNSFNMSNDSISPMNATADMQAQLEMMEKSDDDTQRLQAAFLHFCHHNVDQANSLIQESFPVHESGRTTLDYSVITVSGNILDDFPSCDPRWADSVPNDLLKEQPGSYGSLILVNQIQDKQSAHKMFLTFLNKCGIWNRLSWYTKARKLVITHLRLQEHEEKLAAAIALWHKHSSCTTVLDAAIRRVLLQRGILSKIGALTIKDLYYREVTKIEDIFKFLLNEETYILDDINSSSAERYNTVMSVCTIFQEMISTAIRCRSDVTESWQEQNKGERFEYHPWTLGTKDNDLRKFALDQHKLVLERGLPEAEDSHEKSMMLKSLTNLIDLVLEDYRIQLDSLNGYEPPLPRYPEVFSSFERDRSRLLAPLLEIDQLDLLVKLSEKHKDFLLLIRACVRMDKQDLLISMMKKYKAQGFAQFAFKYFLDNNNYRAMLNCGSGTSDEELDGELTKFLAAHPKLAWMHQTRRHQFSQASETLRCLAEAETASVVTKKSYLSLSKLASVFSDANEIDISENCKDIDREQVLLKYQETLPLKLVEQHKMEYDSMPVLSPERLIELYTCKDNRGRNEVDFKKALELLSYINQDHHKAAEELKAMIWCRAIICDSWNEIDANSDYFVDFSHTTFFKLLSLITEDFDEHSPDVEIMLMRDEVRKLVENSLFEHMVRASVERLRRSIVSDREVAMTT